MEDLFLSLIICTYNRPTSTVNLLSSLERQARRPEEVLIIDGSTNDLTEQILADKNFALKIKYFHVSKEQRGLTRQRNFGIAQVASSSKIIAFLDDDVILDSEYFRSVLNTYKNKPKAIGVGGYITNEVKWNFVGKDYQPGFTDFYFDGWVRKEQSRMLLRKVVGLYPQKPGRQPGFSHGLSIGYFPPSEHQYRVDFLMGCAGSFKTELFKTIQFSEYFEGYGLYEDLDFTLRASKVGELYLNTSAKLEHYHHPDGRPNSFRYGVMVVRNGWYVWRTGNPNPKLMDKLKWVWITILLMVIRLLNVVTGPHRVRALKETSGRLYASIKLIFSKPV